MAHPHFLDPWDYANPKVSSFHEAVTGMALHMARHPDLYSDLPTPVADLLFQINEAVALVAGFVMSDPEHPSKRSP